MSVHALPLHPSYPWNAQAWGPTQCSQPGKYFTAPSTQNTTYKTAMSGRPQIPTPTVTTNTFPFCYPQVAGYAMSATFMSLSPPNRSTNHVEFPRATQKSVFVEPMWSSSWSVMMSAPPPHTRSLYATIPLPPDDSPPEAEPYPTKCEARRSAESLTSSSSFAPQPSSIASDASLPFTPKGAAAASAHPDPIQLHPSLQNAGISVSPLSMRSLDSSSASASPVDRHRGRDAPATTPRVVDLTLLINSTGQTVHVKPSSCAGSQVVTVGDVLDVLEAAFMTISDTSHNRRRLKRKYKAGPVGERISVILKSIQTWWATSGGSETGPCL